MPVATPAMVISGIPFRVLSVSGRTPTGLVDFVDAKAFTIDMDGSPYSVAGDGRVDDDKVRFHEKDVNNGKDVRVWTLCCLEDGSFCAEQATAF